MWRPVMYYVWVIYGICSIPMDIIIFYTIIITNMKGLENINESNGVTLYAYSVNGKQVSQFMKLSDLQNEVKPEGAVIVSAFINGGKF